MRPICALAFLVGVAHADGVPIRTGHVPREIARLAITVDRDAASLRATLVFRRAPTRCLVREIRLPLKVRAGVAVTGMRYSIGRRSPLEALVRDASVAHELYERVVDRQNDPALLEHVGRTRSHELLELALFPVECGALVIVTLDLAGSSDGPRVDATTSLFARGAEPIENLLPKRR